MRSRLVSLMMAMAALPLLAATGMAQDKPPAKAATVYRLEFTVRDAGGKRRQAGAPEHGIGGQLTGAGTGQGGARRSPIHSISFRSFRCVATRFPGETGALGFGALSMPPLFPALRLSQPSFRAMQQSIDALPIPAG